MMLKIIWLIAMLVVDLAFIVACIAGFITNWHVKGDDPLYQIIGLIWLLCAVTVLRGGEQSAGMIRRTVMSA